MNSLTKYMPNIGTKYNRFTLIAISNDLNKNRSCVGIFKCDCGNICEKVISQVISGHIKSCGCLKIESIKMANTLNLTGIRFGKLIAIEKWGKTQTGQGVYWKCECDCGNITKVLAASLRSKHCQSCGCLHKERVSRGESHYRFTPKSPSYLEDQVIKA